MAEARRTRANGEASRERILDAATEITGERGYEGTSISLVSKRSGLPASSIYWHFKDKDELVAAVIDRSYTRWMAELERPVPVPFGAGRDELFRLMAHRIGSALATFPDFLRLGLMLVLEKRPEELTARARFVEVRQTVGRRIQEVWAAFFPELGPADIEQLVMLTFVMADGLFIANQTQPLDLSGSFDLLATAISATAAQIAHQAASATRD
ncbi:TetR/AcrR family transcriptional regulator [Microtetraspora sp. AC03309]|uniref:TetR/AcrR family transcriptional regulator n=1 Tax=Microtetraspora sp. AC03309 TaxID=2779376 RepID=UPI001E29B1CF|nr:TetR/AcrR family transcriptional regulator [Microtetraspora sp. AC03309]MCC5575367.1 TetR/AcrR family transcriptional regulator [Microtetraspora sp. AC03309]